MDTQTLSHFAHIQTEGAAYSTFHLCMFVPVRHTNLYLCISFKTFIYIFPVIHLLFITLTYTKVTTTSPLLSLNTLFNFSYCRQSDGRSMGLSLIKGPI